MLSLRTLLAATVTSIPLLGACISHSSPPAGGGDDGGVVTATDAGHDGATSSPGSDGSTGSTSCKWTVSGGATGSGSCQASAAFAANNAIMAFGIVQTVQSSPTFAFSVQFGDTPAFTAGTYTTANVQKANGEYLVLNGTSASAWTFADDDGGVSGGFTLTISQTGAEITVDAGDAWPTPHGSLTVTLQPSTGATGTVTGTATF